MSTDQHADDARAHQDKAGRLLDRADSTEPSKLSRDLYMAAQVEATLALVQATLALRPVPTEGTAAPRARRDWEQVRDLRETLGGIRADIARARQVLAEHDCEGSEAP